MALLPDGSARLASIAYSNIASPCAVGRENDQISTRDRTLNAAASKLGSRELDVPAKRGSETGNHLFQHLPDVSGNRRQMRVVHRLHRGGGVDRRNLHPAFA